MIAVRMGMSVTPVSYFGGSGFKYDALAQLPPALG